MKTFMIAEIGINHNGELDIAKKLIDGAVEAGSDAVKFQKRTVEEVYTKEELDKPRENPFGPTNGDLKRGLEFGKAEYDAIDTYCKQKGIQWLASAWDMGAQDFLKSYDLKYNKIASAMLTYDDLIQAVANEGKYTFISTGMSTMEEIAHAVGIFEEVGCPYELMHCNSTYPMENAQANLRVIHTLSDKFKCKVGYSGHEKGRIVSLAAVAMGATSIERHITLDKTMFGSDQAASLEIADWIRLVQDVRELEQAMGDGIKEVQASEVPIKEKLRRY